MPRTHRERLEITLSGERPDSIPIALWRHFPVDDQDPFKLAQATIAFQEEFDFDLVKVSPPSSFCLKDWGILDEWQGSSEGTRTYTKRVIHQPEDWLKLDVLDPSQGYLGKQLQCLRLLKDAFLDHTPFLQTIFNPLSQAKNLVGPEKLAVHLRKYPDALHQGLRTISETTLRFIKSAKQHGISGIFFAVQHATHKILSEDEYLEFGVRYDRPILEAVDELWLNMLHLHGDEIMFDLVADYPVQILNWHDRETSPNLAEGLRRFSGCVCGGISRDDSFVLGTPEKIKAEALEAFKQTKGKRLILGTGCVLPLNTPYGNIKAARDAAEALAQ